MVTNPFRIRPMRSPTLKTTMFPAALAVALAACTAGSAHDRPAPPAEPVPATVSLPTGVRLEYTERGDPRGVPVILLHGYTDSRHSFDLTAPHLPASLRVFALSMRGHGNSDRPEASYRPADFAADVSAFLDVMGLESAVIVGHSLGGIIAQRFAIDYPSRTRALVLAATFAADAGHPLFRSFYDQSLAGLTDPVDPAFGREFQVSTITRPVPPEFLELVVSETMKLPARVWKAVMEGVIAEDQSAARSGIRVPTLIIWGDQDAYSGRGEQAALAAIPGATMIAYEGTGHAVHWEEPVRFAADVAAFIRQVGRGE